MKNLPKRINVKDLRRRRRDGKTMVYIRPEVRITILQSAEVKRQRGANHNRVTSKVGRFEEDAEITKYCHSDAW